MKSPKKITDKSPAKPVFYDPTSHRLVFFTVFSIVFLVLAVVWFVLFVAHLYESELPPRATETATATVETGLETAPRYPLSPQVRPSHPLPLLQDFDAQPGTTGAILLPDTESAIPHDFQKATVHAFIPYWSTAGVVETRANIATVDVLLPEWFSIDHDTGEINDLPATQREKVREIWSQNRERLLLLPVARAAVNAGDDRAVWLASPREREDLVTRALALVFERDLDGLCFDFSGAPADDVDAITAISVALKNAFARAQRESCVIAKVDDPLLQHPSAANLADRLIVLAFQEPGPFSGPAPLAAHGWYEDHLSALLSTLPAEKLVIALGSFGMDWISGVPDPEYLNFFDITEAVARQGGTIEIDRESLNPRASYRDVMGRRHQIWFLDAISAHNQLAMLPLDRIGGVAIWPVSEVDPGVWDLFSAGLPMPMLAPFLLQEIRPAFHVKYAGKGPLLRVQNSAQPGRRILSTDPESGLITDVTYIDYPRAFTVALSGTLPENSVILTFDDGPTRTYTPRILDILRQYDVPAVFFVVGNRVQNAPEIARRIVEEGHELGVHTYSHPNIANISDLRLTLELHASQELIESVSGLNTNLFRAPYGFDENSETPDEARVLSLLSKERYVVVGIEIDSADWTRPGVDKIVETVTSLVQANQGNVILFHDAGGDREQTVQALPRIIEALQGMGVSIVPLSGITGLYESLEPAGVAKQPDQISSFSFWLIRSFKSGMTAIFIFLIAVGIVRSLTILVQLY